ncbi:MAG: Fic family protein [Actinomycetaceae bacterium]|nr:Fic family protein [Actinomycetaceae bacterium]
MNTYPTLKKLGYTDPGTDHCSARRASPSAVTLPITIGDHPLFYLITPEMLQLTEQVWLNEGRVSRTFAALPARAREQYNRSLLVGDIVATNGVENIVSTRREAYTALTAPGGARVRHASFASLLSLLLRPNRTPSPSSAPDFTTLTDIRRIYDRVTTGEIAPENQPDGELFRAGPVGVISASQKILHHGFTPEEKIAEALQTAINEWLNSSSTRLNAAIVGHLIFEIAHPFYDGNGRTGRYLLTAQLAQALSITTALKISSAILDNRADYYRHFAAVEDPRNYAETTHFIAFFLELVLEAQESILVELTENGRVLRDFIDDVDVQFPDQTSAAIMRTLAQNQVFLPEAETTLDELAHELGVSKATVRGRLEGLLANGVIKFVSHRPIRVVLAGAYARA